MRTRFGLLAAAFAAVVFAVPIGRPAVSEHLQVLRTAKLALVERRGREWHYYLDPRPLTDIGSWLNGILVHWTRRVDDLEAVARRGRKVT